jgi:hypothetical protein
MAYTTAFKTAIHPVPAFIIWRQASQASPDTAPAQLTSFNYSLVLHANTACSKKDALANSRGMATIHAIPTRTFEAMCPQLDTQGPYRNISEDRPNMLVACYTCILVTAAACCSSRKCHSGYSTASFNAMRYILPMSHRLCALKMCVANVAAWRGTTTAPSACYCAASCHAPVPSVSQSARAWS